MFDKERTGAIAASELRMIFAALPERLSDQEIEEMLRAADRDGEFESRHVPSNKFMHLSQLFKTKKQKSNLF